MTKNGGKKWSNVVANIPDLPANTWVSHIEASVHDKATAYAVFDGHTANDVTPYVYKTNDYGKTWQSIAGKNIEGFARNIQEDYENPDLLFLGTEFGLYVTLNGGQDWLRFTNNMPATAVHYIDLQAKTNDLVLGTHGRGVIIIDDISPLRELSAEVLKKKFHFFANDPTVIQEQNGFGGGSTETQFVGANPSPAAQISYFMNKRHIFGKMKLEVFDSDGNKVADLPAGKAKGVNIINWNYRLKPPKIAKGKTFTFGGFTAPRVAPGEYKVVMTKGKKTFETSVELISDPKSPLSKRARKKLHKTVMKLYNMTQELAYLVYQVDQHLELATSSESADNKALTDALTQLKESLVITTGDNYVGSAEPQLREKLANLYSKITAGYEVPSKSELANLSLLTSDFDKAKASFDQIITEQSSVIKQLKAGAKEASSFEVKSYDDFIAD